VIVLEGNERNRPASDRSSLISTSYSQVYGEL